MAYDELLAARVLGALGPVPGLTEKKMFGGVAFMLHGNMAVGVSGGSLMVRVGPEQYDWALQQPGAREFDMTGRPMKGWVLVRGTAVQQEADLRTWVQRGVDFAASLPPK